MGHRIDDRAVVWCVSVSSRRSNEILRTEYFDSRIAAEIRRLEISVLPAPAEDEWAISIDLIR